MSCAGNKTAWARRCEARRRAPAVLALRVPAGPEHVT
ncbi:hypothetical protein CBM2587_B10030 [Cupriavidus taiwanensis]|uniref:Uncharacterized protein n=1 Tax=Cupriavidus taiwanensis TaxID=164546 RepID=A0A976A318_9BURK|nr:hypothetical protein CBM2587_B10030 [Cupriavidus taiwanensis]